MRKNGSKIEANGASIHVEETGNPHGRELLFLHGGGGSLDDWDGVIDAFEDCRCVLIDSRGHGASTLGTDPLSYRLLAADAETVIAERQMTSPVIIGHSDGGITGLHVAARGNRRLSGLVTIGANGDAPATTVMRNIYDLLTPEKWRGRFPETVEHYQSLNPEPDFEKFFKALLSMWRNTATGNYPGRIAQTIRCPALIIGGDEDHLVLRDETVALANAIAGAKLGLIAFGSHVPHQDQPELVLPLIKTFLSKL
ncbi:alpha/beta hydrolase [Paracoccus caeni]|uniref:Alpha/beta hydrolase n=1 Tax=Paracoccus caeni TaxID=657651 RepID=A0A934SCA2_9RHOB|nr:alpha/beta hydrolase [Paracoccus caeni]MBK4216201.1 alpha/beta hydrolase [Paracoccus caeni]